MKLIAIFIFLCIFLSYGCKSFRLKEASSDPEYFFENVKKKNIQMNEDPNNISEDSDLKKISA